MWLLVGVGGGEGTHPQCIHLRLHATRRPVAAMVTAKPELYVRVETGGWTRYRAWSRDGSIEFRGTTIGYAKDVEEILRRMVRAEAEPPEVVVRTARLLFDHIETYIRRGVLGDGFVGTAVDYEAESPYASYTLRIEVETLRVYTMSRVAVGGGENLGPAEPGWLVTIKATYEGYDGYGEGRHTAKVKMLFKGRVDTDVLWGEMMRVIKHAVNALPPE